MNKNNVFKKALVFTVIILFIGIAFHPNFGIIGVSKGRNNTEYDSVDALGWATLNVHVDIKDIFGNIVEPLDNARVVARAISPKLIQTLFCRAIGKTNEFGDCTLKVPVIKNEVMTYLVYSISYRALHSFKKISISENENKNIGLVLFSFNRHPFSVAVLNVHVEKKTIFGNVPVERATVMAKAFAPKCLATFCCGGKNITDDNGDCSIMSRVINDEEVYTHFIVISFGVLGYLPAIGFISLKPYDVKEVFLEFRRF